MLNSCKCSSLIKVRLFSLWKVPSLISVHLKVSTFFVVSHVMSAKVSHEWRLNPGFRTNTMCPFPLNRGVPSIEVTDTKTMWTFFQDKIVVCPEWRCPLNRGVPKERFHRKLCRGRCVEKSARWLDSNEQFVHRIHKVHLTLLDCDSQWRFQSA